MATEVVMRPLSHPKLNAEEVAIKYAKDVLTGAIVAGKLVKLAAKRFIEDWKYKEVRGLIWRKEEAQRVVDFFGFLKHTKGEWGGETFTLLPWQVFVLANLFGWYNVDGTRRFREVYIEVARKNGKTTLMAGIGLYMLLMDNEPGAEIYSAAKTKEQARIVFDEAVAMRSKSRFLSSRIDVTGNKKPVNLHVLATRGKFEPLCSDDTSLDGKNVHCGLIDELHAHPDRTVYDVIYEGTASRRQPMIVAITTAGHNRESVCYKQRELAEKILTGLISADEGKPIFAFVACIDEEDDWQQEQNWYKANPSLAYGVVKLDKLQQAALKAKEDPTALNSFLRKHLNVWTSQEVKWMDPLVWARCTHNLAHANPVELMLMARDMLKGRTCVGAYDLSSKIDLTAIALIFPGADEDTRTEEQRKQDAATKDAALKQKLAQARTQEERDNILLLEKRNKLAEPTDKFTRILLWYFMPQESIEKRSREDRVPYDAWAKQGFIEATPGATVNYAFVKQRIETLMVDYYVYKLGFDDWNAHQLNDELTAMGVPIEKVVQGYKTLSDPMKDLHAMAVAGKLEHFNNPVLNWNVGNVQAIMDPQGNCKPDKSNQRQRIDGAVASIMGVAVLNLHATAVKPSIYETQGITFL